MRRVDLRHVRMKSTVPEHRTGVVRGGSSSALACEPRLRQNPALPCRHHHPWHAPTRDRAAIRAICCPLSSAPRVRGLTCRAPFRRGPGCACSGVCSSRRCYTARVYRPCPLAILSCRQPARTSVYLDLPASMPSLRFDLPDPTGRQPLDQRRIDPPHRFSVGDAGIAGSDAEWLEKHNAPFILKGSSNAGLVVGADEFPSIFSLAAEHSGDIPARRHRHLRSPLRRCHPSART